MRHIKPTVLAVGIVTITAAVHFGIAASLTLIEDEAYYMLWASGPSIGYYDHPPMIAWLIACSTAVFGNTPLGIRALPIGLHLATGLLVWDLARRLLHSANGGIAALLLFFASPLMLGLGTFATPDTPSTFFWTATLWALFKARRDDTSSSAWWLLSGLFAGAGLLSKLTNLFLLPGVLLWLLASGQDRHWLRHPGPWLGLAVTCLVVAPYLVWNLQNDWLGTTRQISRVEGVGTNLAGPVLFFVTIFGTFSPISSALGLNAALGAARNNVLLLSCTSLPLLIFLAVHATHSATQANWHAPLLGAFAVMAAAGAHGIARLWLSSAVGLAISLSAAMMTLLFLLPAPLFTAHTPPNQVRGWPAYRAAIEAQASSSEAVWIATAEYGLTGSLWYHLAERPVWSITELERYLFRGTFPEAFCDAVGLFVLRAEDDPDIVTSAFQTVTPLGSEDRVSGGKTLFTTDLFRVAGLRSPTLCPGS